LFGSDASLTIENCVFKDNKGNLGGAIYVTAGLLTIHNGTFVENDAAIGGGAIFIEGGTRLYLPSSFAFFVALRTCSPHKPFFRNTDKARATIVGSIFTGNTAKAR